MQAMGVQGLEHGMRWDLDLHSARHVAVLGRVAGSLLPLLPRCGAVQWARLRRILGIFKLG